MGAAKKVANESLDVVVERLDEATLRTLVIQAAVLHADVERAVRLAASGPDGRLDTLRSAVDSELRTRRYLDYRDAMEWASDVQPIIDALALEIDAHPSRELLVLLERAIGHSIKVILKGDDSSGALGDVSRDLLELHERLCDKGVADPIALATWMAKFMFDDQDFFDRDPVRYATALGEAGLATFRSLVEKRAAADPRHWGVRHAMERLAIVDDDVEQVVALLGGDLSHALQFIHVAEAMLELDRPEEALAWSLRGVESTTGPHVARLYDIAAGVLAERGDLRAVLELRGAEHERWANSTTYAKVRAASVAVGTWPGPRDHALGFLAARDPGGYVDVLLAEGDVDAAWATATRSDEWKVGAERWERLAEAREKTHPADAMNLYLGLVETTLEKADSRAYSVGIRLLKSAKRAAVAADAVVDFDAYVLSLRERYRRRPSLIEKLDKAGFR